MKTILITGASGTVGRAFIRNYSKKYQIISYSRNEKAQVALKREFPMVEILLGSVEDSNNLENIISKYRPEIIIHAAALKHVDTAEKQPSQAIIININGTLNILKLAQKYNVQKVVGISTDKACSADNVYGMTKYLMERIFEEYNSENMKTSCCRFGNVAWSNGSVLPFWLNRHKQGLNLPVTHVDMTRLIFTSDNAAKLIDNCVEMMDNYPEFFILSKNMKSVKMIDLAHAISKNTEVVGLRPGEKMFEDLISRSELNKAYYIDDNYIVLSEYGFDKFGISRLDEPLNSDTAEKMTENDICDILEDVDNHLVERLKFNY